MALGGIYVGTPLKTLPETQIVPTLLIATYKVNSLNQLWNLQVLHSKQLPKIFADSIIIYIPADKVVVDINHVSVSNRYIFAVVI